MRQLLVILGIVVLYTLNTSAQLSEGRIKELDKYFERARQDWEVPGMAIAIVKDDKPVLLKGYGVRDIEKGGAVDENTMFAIASNTKAFTTAALAILVDEGKLNWNDKVSDYLPYFKLYDPYVTQEITVRDLICHRSGLKTFAGDLVWYASNYSREEIVKRARFLESTYGFREHYGYSNIMFLTAGEVIEAISSKSWDDYITEKILLPLGMKRTNTTINNLEGMDNVAAPHTEDNGKVISIPYLNWDNIGPAGSLNSCVKDLTSWIKLQLNNGAFNDNIIFSKNASREMWSPQTIQSIGYFQSTNMPSIHFKAYGLGWGMFDYLGRKIIGHSGGYDGMISYTVLVPEENLGFVILTNKNSTLYYPLIYKILDNFLGGEEKDWSQAILKLVTDGEKRQEEALKKDEEARIKNTKPTLALEKYTGTFGGDLYGNAEVALEDEKLIVRFLPAPLFVGTLNHWHYDTYQIKMINFPTLPPGKVNFVINAKGEVEEMKIDIPNPDFDFTELEFKRIK